MAMVFVLLRKVPGGDTGASVIAPCLSAVDIDHAGVTTLGINLGGIFAKVASGI